MRLIIGTKNVCAYLHVIKHAIYVCPPYGNGLDLYVHSIIMIIIILNGMHLCMYVYYSTVLYSSGLLVLSLNE